jgi:hypothetical protein
MKSKLIAFAGAMLSEKQLKSKFEWWGNYYIGDDRMIHGTRVPGSNDFPGWFWHLALDRNKGLGPAKPHRGWTAKRLSEVGAWGVYRLKVDRKKHPEFRTEHYQE